MAYVDRFEYDIFISYAHVDNLAATGKQPWVEAFHKRLDIALAQRIGRMGVVQIWRDKRLAGDHFFDETISKGLENAALFIALTSNGYLASDYCLQELKAFHDKADAEPFGLQIGDRSRIYVALLNNIPHTQWPEEYGRISGHPFHDAEDDDGFGQPSDLTEKRFDRQLRALADSLYRMLLAFKEAVRPSEQPPMVERHVRSDDQPPSVLLVSHPSDMGGLFRLASYLNDQGVRPSLVQESEDEKGRQSLLEQRLRHCDAVLIYWDRASGSWVENRLIEVIKGLISSSAIGVYIAVYADHPDKKDFGQLKLTPLVKVEMIAGRDPFSPAVLEPFLGRIKGRNEKPSLDQHAETAKKEPPAAQVRARRTDVADSISEDKQQRVFMCYAHEDEKFALSLAGKLKESGIPVWIDKWDIPQSSNWRRGIDKALREHDLILVVLSPNSVESVEVEAEWSFALNKKKTVFPVLYRQCEIPYRLEVLQWTDFTSEGLKDKVTFQSLVRALKSS